MIKYKGWTIIEKQDHVIFYYSKVKTKVSSVEQAKEDIDLLEKIGEKLGL